MKEKQIQKVMQKVLKTRSQQSKTWKVCFCFMIDIKLTSIGRDCNVKPVLFMKFGYSPLEIISFLWRCGSSGE